MGGFAGGLIVGFLLGGAVVFAVLERPWESAEEPVAEVADAGPVEEPGGKKKARKRRRPRRQTADEMVELTAADRKLVWRGQKPQVEEKQVDFSGGGGGRALDRGEIDAGIAGVADGIIDCIKDARGNAELTAKITLEARVEADGRVGPARVRAPAYLHENGLLPCMRRTLGGARFAATGAQTVVTVPFDLY